MKTSRRMPIWLLFVPIILMALAHITFMLDADPLNRPEENTLRNIIWMGNAAYPNNQDNFLITKAQVIEFVDRFSAQHIPGHFLQLSFWSDAVGFDLIIMRVVSMFYYVMSCAMVYRLARDLINERVAIFASLFVILSGYHMYYAHEIRMYAVLVTQTLFILWSYWRIVISLKSNHWYHFLLLFAWTVWGLYTHVIIIFPLATIGIYHFIFAPKNRVWLQVAGTQLLAGIMFLPWLPSAIYGIQDAKDLSDTSQSTLEVLGSSLFIYTNGFWVGGLLLLGLFIWKFPRKNRNLRQFAILGIIMIVVLLAFNFAFSYIPYRRMRYTLLVLPILATFWGYGLYVLYQIRRELAGVFVVVWMGMLVWFIPSNEMYTAANLEGHQFSERYPFQILGDYMRRHYIDYPSLEDDLVVYHPTIQYSPGLLNYYEHIYNRNIVTFTEDFRSYHFDRLGKLSDAYPGFWFSYRSQDETLTREWMQSEQVADFWSMYQSCLQVDVSDEIQLYYYLDARLSCDILMTPERQAIVYNNGYILQDYAVEQEDNLVDVSLSWRNPEMVFDDSFGYSLQVFRDGEKVGQVDSPIHNIVTYSQVVLDDVQSGYHTVHLIMYDSETISSVAGESDFGAVFDRNVEIANFEISESSE